MTTCQVIQVCLLSRLVISLLAVVANLLPDHQADAFRNDLLAQYPPASLSTFDRAILWTTEPFTRWDAQYFLAIAHENRYLHEQMLAFFPMFPLVIRHLAFGLQGALQSLLSLKINLLSSLLLGAYLVNLVAFILAGCFLYHLTMLMCNSKQLSLRVLYFFAFNPASIFFTAYYTEALYSCFTFGALYALYRFKAPALSTILIACSAYTRSNGSISFLYVAFFQAVQLLSQIKSSQSVFRILARFILYTAVYGLICLIPLRLYLWFAWEQFCDQPEPGIITPQWCDLYIPFPYSSVQSKYWEVGFLRYYQLKKIPNFLMGGPSLALVIWSTVAYLTANRAAFVRLICSIFVHSPRSPITSFIEPTRPQKDNKKVDLFRQCCLLPFALHSLFLATFCLLFMHVEVATRFLFSSSPWPYWALLHLTSRNLLGSRTKSLVTGWLAAYCLLGTAMFANFLPFT